MNVHINNIALFGITPKCVGVYMWEFNLVRALTHIQKPLGNQVREKAVWKVKSENQASVKRRFWTGQLIIDMAPLNIVLSLLLLKLEKPTEICNLPLFTINVIRLCNFCGFCVVQLQVEFLRWVWVKTITSMKIGCFDVLLHTASI